jgi:putative ABC transport system substrate-binding protein
MRRRDFILALGAATTAWPISASAQGKLPLVGFLGSASAGPWAGFVAAFLDGLKEAGFTAGQNVSVTFRWADGEYDRLAGLASALVGSGVDVLVATGGLPTVMAAKTATATIPIVFTLGTDPVATGIVASLNRPGGNITGAQLFTASIDPKRFGLLHDVAPNAALTAVLVNPKNPNIPERARGIEAAAHTLGKRIQFLHASTPQELEQAFTTVGDLHAGALFVGADPFFNTSRNAIVALAARHRIPAIYEQREFAVAGGLMSYGTDFLDSYRQAGIYAGRILKGEKPADLPVVQATKFEFVINLKTARALGIEVPPGVSAQADEIIE